MRSANGAVGLCPNRATFIRIRNAIKMNKKAVFCNGQQLLETVIPRE
jgi:hypothetical protein